MATNSSLAYSEPKNNGGKDNITLIVARFLAPQNDEPPAFVEAEVPPDELTKLSSDAAKSTVIFDDPAKSASQP